MPIVKKKINLNVLQIAVAKDLRRRSCRPVVEKIHTDENSRSTCHPSVENVIVQTHPSKEALRFQKRDSEQFGRNIPKKVKLRAEIGRNQQETATLRTKLEYHEQIRSVSAKILLIGSQSHIKTRTSRLLAEEKVKQLVTLMLNSQMKFSKERKKLFRTIQQLHKHMIKNETLNQQMKGATLEQYIDLSAEINRNGEKREEIKKVMTTSRKQFESDVAGATQLREKLCDFQNRLQFSELDVHNFKEDNFIKKQNLSRLLHLKNELRMQKDNLQQY